jgi:hypothetical protein
LYNFFWGNGSNKPALLPLAAMQKNTFGRLAPPKSACLLALLPLAAMQKNTFGRLAPPKSACLLALLLQQCKKKHFWAVSTAQKCLPACIAAAAMQKKYYWAVGTAQTF